MKYIIGFTFITGTILAFIAYKLTNKKSTQTKLKIIGKNEYGDYIYSEDPKGTIHISDLDVNKVWTILNPSSAIKNIFPNNVVRQYGNNTVLMSEYAAEKITPADEGNGAVVVIRTTIEDKNYFVIVGDNKKYLMNCGGALDQGETYEAGAIREVYEELKIDISSHVLDQIAEWSLMYKNKLVGDYSWKKTTKCFLVDVEYEDMCHLIPYDDELEKINIYEFNDYNYDFYLSETEYVLIIRDECVGENIETSGKKLNGHHQKILCKIMNIENDINVGYLEHFRFI